MAANDWRWSPHTAALTVPAIDPRARGDSRSWPSGRDLRRIHTLSARVATYSLVRALFRTPIRSPAPITLQLRRQLAAAEVLCTGRLGLGPLEIRLLELLWTQEGPATVHHVQGALPELAYTTLMTTLDRLYRKGLLLRHKYGRAFAYAPRCTRAELLGELISGHVTNLLGPAEESTALLLTLVRALGRNDVTLLDELDALVKAERLRLRTEAK